MILLGERFNVEGGGRNVGTGCIEGTYVIVTLRDILAGWIVLRITVS
jgi:hypothetical protein